MESEKHAPRTDGPVCYLNALARLPPWLLLAACLAVLQVFLLLAPYAHPSTDDFCMAAGIRQQGLLQYLWSHYLEWSGRYAGNTLYGLYPLLFGMFDGYPYLPVLLVSALFAACVFLLASLFRLKPFDGCVLLTSVVFVCLYLLGMISPASSLFWMAGALSYQSANILLLVALALMLRLMRRQDGSGGINGLLVALLPVLVIAVGCNETGMLALVAAVFLFLLIRLRTGPARVLPWILLFSISLCCAALVYFSPGNAVRAAAFPLRHDLLRALGGSMETGSRILLIWAGNPVLLAATLLVPYAAIELYQRSGLSFRVSKRQIAAAAACTVSVPFLFQFPAWWAMGGWAPARAIDAAYFVFLLGWLLTAAAISLRVARDNAIPGRLYSATVYARWFLLVASLLFTLAVLGSDAYRLAQSDRAGRAERWDDYMQQRYALIRSAVARGESSLVVPDYVGEYPRSIYFNDIVHDSRDWRNACYADYFGLQSIKRERSAQGI